MGASCAPGGRVVGASWAAPYRRAAEIWALEWRGGGQEAPPPLIKSGWAPLAGGRRAGGGTTSGGLVFAWACESHSN